MLKKNSKIFITGHKGLVGSSILEYFKKKNFKKIITKSRKQLDLTNTTSVEKFFKKNKVDILIMCAAKVGGILDNSLYPSEYFYENSMIQNNLLRAAKRYKIKRTLFMGTACIYPKFSKVPIMEEQLLSGYLEKTNEAYAIAKISGIKYAQSLFEQYNMDVVCLMPSNLYGLNDNYNPMSSHVIPGLINKFITSKKKTYQLGFGEQEKQKENFCMCMIYVQLFI